MSMGEVRGLITVVTFLTFIGICWWAYRASNRARFEEDALMPFLDDEPPEIRRGIDARGEDR
jgi:cytochrome c oxidase cbb3-type subunit 4